MEGAADANTIGPALRQALLAPRRVALVGASDDPAKTAARPLQYLRRIGFAGAIYPINPRRDQVGGEPAWRSLAEVPERPDHAYILTPTESAIAAVEECGRLGIPVATVLGLQFSFLLAGTIIIENVFTLPGLGRLVFQAIAQRDLVVVEALVTLLAASVILVNFIVDFVYALIDPRLAQSAAR